MAHNIESIAWTNEKPWHGLGVEVDGNLSVAQMLKAAKLNWTVSRRPMMFGKIDQEGQPDFTKGEVVPDFYALTRDSDNKVLDVIGSRYQPVQNSRAFEIFHDLVEAGGATMETAGSLRGGRVVWGLARLKADFNAARGDKVNSYLLVMSPHEQGKSMQAFPTTVRVVCNNTLTAALHRGESSLNRYVHAHRAEFDDIRLTDAQRVMGVAHEQIEEQAKVIKAAAQLKLTVIEAREFLAKVIQPAISVKWVKDNVVPDGGDKPVKFLELAVAALEHAPTVDAVRGTLWNAVNAVTYTADHLMGRTVDRRLDRAWFGSTARIKRDAMQAASELLATK